MTDDEKIVAPRGRWKLSRPCYNKPHRCPGWTGGGWTVNRADHCAGGYITFGMSKAEMSNLREEDWDHYPRPFALGQCTKCDVVVLPFWTRRLSPFWWWRELWWALKNWLWWRRAVVVDWWRARREVQP